MSLLVYQDSAKSLGDIDGYRYFTSQQLCPYCRQPCYVDSTTHYFMTQIQTEHIAVCRLCGWWAYKDDSHFDEYDEEQESCFAVLKEFAIDDPNVPYVELSKYLEKNQERLSTIHPAKCEELVAAVYSDVLGYKIESCSYGRPDGGIDIVCIKRDSGEVSAIQVKRYRYPIKLEQIDQFFGAMVRSQHDRGIFVTTGKFQKGCYRVVEQFQRIGGVHIDLIDGKRLLEFLGLLNRKHDRVICPLWNRYDLDETRRGWIIIPT